MGSEAFFSFHPIVYECGMSEIRRLPVYLLLDTSGSMMGEPLEAVRQGLRALVADLMSEPLALETAHLSVITFSDDARQYCPLTELPAFEAPDLQAGGFTSLGAALTLLEDCLENEVRKSSATQRGDWKPMIFLMTDGQPTDEWEQVAERIKRKKVGNIVACAAGTEADPNVLKQITDNVVVLNDLDPDGLKEFIKWVSDSVKTASQSMAQIGRNPLINLPAPVTQLTENGMVETRRRPVYFLLDTSESMQGEPIQAVREALRGIVAALQTDPLTLETAYLSVITFSDRARQVCPLTELLAFKEPILQVGGVSCLGTALMLLEERLENEVHVPTATRKGDWEPLICLMTAGQPSDDWLEVADRLKRKYRGYIVACGAGAGADPNVLKLLTDMVIQLPSLESNDMEEFCLGIKKVLLYDSDMPIRSSD